VTLLMAVVLRLQKHLLPSEDARIGAKGGGGESATSESMVVEQIEESAYRTRTNIMVSNGCVTFTVISQDLRCVTHFIRNSE
jgi:hypothetical protein